MRGAKPQPRVPVAPLEAWLNARHTSPTRRADSATGGVLAAERIGEICGVGTTPLSGRSIVQRWRTRGLTVWQADRVATHLGVHPCAIWPEWGADVEVAS